MVGRKYSWLAPLARLSSLCPYSGPAVCTSESRRGRLFSGGEKDGYLHTFRKTGLVTHHHLVRWRKIDIYITNTTFPCWSFSCQSNIEFGESSLIRLFISAVFVVQSHRIIRTKFLEIWKFANRCRNCFFILDCTYCTYKNSV